MKVVLIVAFVIIVIAGALVAWIGFPKGPSLDSVSYLKSPRITTMPRQKVLQVTAQGSPKTTPKNAFGLLMKTYFKLKGVPKGGPDFKAPRARWPMSSIALPADQWVGYYAIPVPESIENLPAVKNGNDDMKVELVPWEYGAVAEILHVGGYDKETATIKTLTDFIDKNGYAVTGHHEEEYLKGPGMIFAGNPDTYLTIIRYQVAKK